MKTNTYDLMRRERDKSIIEVSKSIFFSKGIENTTMKDIANEAQISRQTLYSYYKDIDELIIAVQSEIFKNIIFNTSPLCKDYDVVSPIEYIKLYIISILKLVNDFPDEMIFIFQCDLHFKLYPGKKTLFEGFDSIFTNLEHRDLVLKKITQGQLEGSIRNDMTDTQIYSVIINITTGLVQRILLLEERVDVVNETKVEDIGKSLLDMMIMYIYRKI